VLDPILVTGCARSGTSLVAGSLHELGAWIGKCAQVQDPTSHPNPKGFFENIYIRDIVNKGILTYLGHCQYGIQSLPKIEEIRDLPAFNPIVTSLATRQGLKSSPWLFKDAKTALIWPPWVRSFPKSRWVITQRRKESIIRSCHNWTFLKQFNIDWDDWVESYQIRLRELAEEVTPLYVDTDILVNGDFGQLREIAKEVGLTWNEWKIKAFIEPKYWNRIGIVDCKQSNSKSIT